MAIEYGQSGAGFADTIARMRAEAAAIAELSAKEAERSAAEERDTTATRENAVARGRTATAVDALVDTIGRSVEVLNAETSAIRANSEAWATNAASRGRTIGVAEGATGGVALANDAAVGTGRQAIPAVVPRGQASLFDEVGAQGALFPTAAATKEATAVSAASSGDLATVAQRNAEALATQAERQAVVNDLANQSAASYAASSQALQRHGALTSEFFQGLAKGQITLQEFQSQMLITLGKFSGWAIAGGLVYSAFEAVKNIAVGIEATQSGVSQLKRSLGEKVNVPEAEAGFRRVSAETNVPIAKVAEAQFYAARAFPNQSDSLAVGRTAALAEKLDEVPVQDAVKAFAALNVEFGLGPAKINEVFNELDAGQLKFNARLNQTLPQIGRAAASFANAGGTPTQLVQQIIELNRATGGGGGQGGGNPATFLIREPGNLAKASTEDTLRSFGFDPKHAQSNIGTFNEEVQKRAAEGKLSKNDLKELATAVGGGTANGLRYGLPLFATGTSGLAAKVRAEVNPEAAAGSAQEDLKHKLEQLNEQGHKAGITLQGIGSTLGSIGVGQALTDSAHGLNLLLSAVQLVTGGVAALVSPLTELPAPLRIAAEAFLTYKAAGLALRSGPGLAARSLAGESALPYGGGGAKELLALRSTQEATVGFAKDEQEKLSRTAFVSGNQARRAAGAVPAFEAANAPGIAASEEEQAAYQQEVARLNGVAARTEAKALADREAADAALREQIAQQDLLNTLKAKSISLEAKFVAAREAGIYGAQAGAPNTLPLLAPNQAAADAQAARRGIPTGIVAGEGVVAGEGLAETTVAASAISGVGSKFNSASSALKGVPAALTGLKDGLLGFIGGLGPLGVAIAGYAAFEGIKAIFTDAKGQNERASAALISIESEVTSEHDAEAKIKSAFHTVSSNPEAILSQGPALLGAAARIAQQKAKGAYRNLGTGAAAPETLADYGEGIKEEFAGLEADEGSKASEKALAGISKRTKLLFDKLQLFGTRGSGKESLQKIETIIGTFANSATSSQNEVELDELAKLGDEATKHVYEQVDHEVKSGLKFASSASGRSAVLAAAQAKLSELTYRQSAIPLEENAAGLAETNKSLASVEAALAKKPGGEQEAGLKKRQESLKGQKAKTEQGRKDLLERAKKLSEEEEEQNEAHGKEAYAEDAAEAKGKGAIAQASPNKLAAAKAALKEARANTEFAEGTLKGKERKNLLPELEAAELKAEQAVAAASLSLVKSKGDKREAQIGNQQPVATAKAALRTAEEELRFIEAHKKDFSAEELLDATTAFLKAKNSAAEAVAQEAQKISQFQTQLQQAHSEGDAVAQASEGLAGANRELAKAVGPEQVRQAQLNIAKEQNTLQKALASRVSAEGELAKSQTNNPLKEAKIEVATDKKLLGLAQGPEEKDKAQAALNNAKKSQTAALVSNREREISFQEEMREISKQQAIQQLDELLKVHNLSKQTREELQSKIRNLEKGAANNQVFDLAPGSIKLPTAYDVHRAASEAIARGGGLLPQGGAIPPAIVRQTNQIIVNVHSASDVPKVGEELERITGGAISTRLRKAGFRGN